jgi:hypothetical protein
VRGNPGFQDENELAFSPFSLLGYSFIRGGDATDMLLSIRKRGNLLDKFLPILV